MFRKRVIDLCQSSAAIASTFSMCNCVTLHSNSADANRTRLLESCSFYKQARKRKIGIRSRTLVPKLRTFSPFQNTALKKNAPDPHIADSRAVRQQRLHEKDEGGKAQQARPALEVTYLFYGALISIYIYLYLNIYIFIYLYIYIFIYLYICIFIYLYIYIYLLFLSKNQAGSGTPGSTASFAVSALVTSPCGLGCTKGNPQPTAARQHGPVLTHIPISAPGWHGALRFENLNYLEHRTFQDASSSADRPSLRDGSLDLRRALVNATAYRWWDLPCPFRLHFKHVAHQGRG